MIAAASCIALLAIGCDKPQPPRPKTMKVSVIEGGVVAADMKTDETTAEARKFFVKWLEEHNEDTIINDKSGVGIGLSATRLWAFGYGKKGESAEVEFRVVLPDGREIQEFVAGIVPEGEDPMPMALANFSTSTLPPVYSCFINEADRHMKHMKHESVSIGGYPFRYTSGGVTAFGTENLPDFTDVSKQVRESLASSEMAVSDQPHWMKVVYALSAGEMITCSVTFDNEPNEMLTKRIEKLDWPNVKDFYIAKEFIVLRPDKSKSR